jgi:hypothetical protein
MSPESFRCRLEVERGMTPRDRNGSIPAVPFSGDSLAASEEHLKPSSSWDGNLGEAALIYVTNRGSLRQSPR